MIYTRKYTKPSTWPHYNATFVLSTYLFFRNIKTYVKAEAKNSVVIPLATTTVNGRVGASMSLPTFILSLLAANFAKALYRWGIQRKVKLSCFLHRDINNKATSCLPWFVKYVNAVQGRVTMPLWWQTWFSPSFLHISTCSSPSTMVAPVEYLYVYLVFVCILFRGS
jgi:hypothetical protein